MSLAVWAAIGGIIVLLIIFGANMSPSVPVGATGTNAPGNDAVSNSNKGTSSGTAVKPGTAGVSFTSSGFSPGYITVRAGDVVRFTNKSSSSMRVISTASGISSGFSFDQNKSVGNGGFFDVAFIQAGTWRYYNLNNARFTGTVVVQER